MLRPLPVWLAATPGHERKDRETGANEEKARAHATAVQFQQREDGHEK